MWFLLACGGDAAPWYEARTPCPEGASLHGAPFEGEPRSLDAGFPYRPGGEIWCGRSEHFEDRHGRLTAWYATGQKSSEATYADGQLTALQSWNPLGHLDAELGEDGVFRRIWTHENGTVALTGAYGDDHAPEGPWIEYDTAGKVIGKTVWAEGKPGPLEGDSRLVLFAPDALGLVWGHEDLTLPVTTSTDSPPLAVSLVLTRKQLVVDGVPVLHLDEDGIPLDERRGSMITKLYDRMLEKNRTSMAIDPTREHPEALLQVDAATPWATVVLVLYTSAQAQFGPFHLVGDTGLQWPPRSGVLEGSPVAASVEVRLPTISATPRQVPPPTLSLGENFRVSTGSEARIFEDLASAEAFVATVSATRQIQIAPKSDAPFAEVMAAIDAVRDSHPDVVLVRGDP